MQENKSAVFFSEHSVYPPVSLGNHSVKMLCGCILSIHYVLMFDVVFFLHFFFSVHSVANEDQY